MKIILVNLDHNLSTAEAQIIKLNSVPANLEELNTILKAKLTDQFAKITYSKSTQEYTITTPEDDEIFAKLEIRP